MTDEKRKKEVFTSKFSWSRIFYQAFPPPPLREGLAEGAPNGFEMVCRTTLSQQEQDHTVGSCHHDTSRIAWAKLLARVGEEFPLACPNCGGDIGLISFIIQPETIRKILTHLGEPLVPPPVSPTPGPPVDWDDLVQADGDHSLHQALSDDLPMIDIHRR